MSDRLRLAGPLLVLALALGGCIPKVQLRDASVTLPEQYSDDATAQDSTATVDWDAFFQDDKLRALIGDALAHNQELGILQAEIDVANAEVIASKGEYIPRLGLGLGAGVEKVGRYTSQGAADEAVDIVPGRHVPEHLPDFEAGFVASWEIDIWRRLWNSSKAARYRYLASIDGRNFMATHVVAEVASSYYELMALDNQLLVFQQNIALLEQGLEAARLQKQAARVTELGVQRFQAELYKNQSRQFEIRQQIVETENRINFLCGRMPQPVPRSSERFAEMVPTPLTAGLPTQLLENRPDVREAEAKLEAAKLDVKATRALFYPSLSLDAEVGVNAFSLKRIALMPESLAYNVVGNLFAPLLNRKGIKARYYTAGAEQMKAVLGYEQTVLSAYIEVQNQLALIGNLDQSYQRRSDQVETLNKAIDTSNDLFRNARAEYLEVLTTRREALDSQLELIETKKRQLIATVDVYQALGGGWTQPGTPNTRPSGR